MVMDMGTVSHIDTDYNSIVFFFFHVIYNAAGINKTEDNKIMELLICPFCGSNNIDINKSNKQLKTCIDCMSISKIWNTRSSQWISVIKELPTHNQEVLVSTSPRDEQFICFYNDKEDYKCFISKERPEMKCRFVSHWMPLPESPTESKEETLPETCDRNKIKDWSL